MSYVKLNEMAKEFGNFYVSGISLETKQDSDEETDVEICMDGEVSPVREEDKKPAIDEIPSLDGMFAHAVYELNKKYKG